MNDDSADEYRAAIGSVVAARKRYDTVCASHGTYSWPAQQAREYLEREIAHRNLMRERHDAKA